jgi:hypothetical protein
MFVMPGLELRDFVMAINQVVTSGNAELTEVRRRRAQRIGVAGGRCGSSSRSRSGSGCGTWPAWLRLHQPHGLYSRSMGAPTYNAETLAAYFHPIRTETWEDPIVGPVLRRLAQEAPEVIEAVRDVDRSLIFDALAQTPEARLARALGMSGLLGFVQFPVNVSQMPASWHSSSAMHTFGLPPLHMPL